MALGVALELRRVPRSSLKLDQMPFTWTLSLDPPSPKPRNRRYLRLLFCAPRLACEARAPDSGWASCRAGTERSRPLEPCCTGGGGGVLLAVGSTTMESSSMAMGSTESSPIGREREREDAMASSPYWLSAGVLALEGGTEGVAMLPRSA